MFDFKPEPPNEAAEFVVAKYPNGTMKLWEVVGRKGVLWLAAAGSEGRHWTIRVADSGAVGWCVLE